MPLGHEARSGPAGDTPDPGPERSLAELRDLLLREERGQVGGLDERISTLERQLADPDAMAALIAPAMGDAIRRKIRDARDEMIEVLYPIIGQTVVRAVSEAISDLQRAVDARMQAGFGPAAVARRIRGRAAGATDGELALREALPFDVRRAFLIHRETGLLLGHVARSPDESDDSDLIGGMLTAIRDFTEDAFGHGDQGDLDVIEVGDLRVLLEAGRRAYLAVVVDGSEPAGFRALMREHLADIHTAHDGDLRHYDGDPTRLTTVRGHLEGLMSSGQPTGLSRRQKRALAAATVLTALVPLVACALGALAWAALHPPAAPAPTAAPLPTMPPPTAPPAALPATSLPPQIVSAPMGVMTGDAWLHTGPDETTPRLGPIALRGEVVELEAVRGKWTLIHRQGADGFESGWVLSEWVGTTAPVPARLVTPEASP